MKHIIILIALAATFTAAHANRTVCKRDYFDPSRTICENEGGYGSGSRRTVCKRDYFDPSKTVCETE
jgi:hypothetical protein